MNESNLVDKVGARITLDVSPALSELDKLKQAMDDTLGSAPRATGRASAAAGDVYLQQRTGAIMTLRQAIKELDLQFKEGEIAAEDYFNKLVSLRTTYKDALDLTTGVGVVNDQALRSAIIRAQGYIQSFESGTLQLAQDSQAHLLQLSDQALGEYQAEIDNKVKMVKTLHDTQLMSARDAYDQLSAIYERDYERFAMDVDKKMQLLKQMYTYEKEAMAQEDAASIAATSAPSIGGGSSHSSGGYGHISAGNMARDMLMFGGMFTIMQNVSQGMVQVTQSAAGLEQVFGTQANTQQKLNTITNQFIDIAKQYGTTVSDVTDAGKLWARQYKDVDTALTLTRNSTMLSIVDNLSVADANKAVESSIQALGLQINNANEAYTSSMKIIDSWTAVSHNTSVSTLDLAQGFERMAASGKQAGLTIDQMSALVAAGVRNSGRSGTVVGNMWKSVLDNIATASPKVQQAFQALGVQMYTVGANGQKELKPIWDLLLELSNAAEHSTVAQTKYFSAIAGGKYQFDTLRAAVTNTQTILNAYNQSLNSAGETQKQAAIKASTLQAELQRLRDEIQQLAYNADSGSFGKVLSDIVAGLTDLLEGLQKMPAAVDWGLVGLAALVAGGKALVGTVNSITSSFKMARNGIKLWGDMLSRAAGTAVDMANAGAAMGANLEADIKWAEDAASATETQASAMEQATAATEANTAAKDVNLAATEEQIAAAAGVDAALATEDAAIDTTTASWLTLDAVSGGLALGIGALITGIGIFSVALGRHSLAANQSAQSAQSLTNSINQQTQAVQQGNQQFDAQVTQLGQLEQQYIDAKSAVDNAKQGTDQYNQAAANLIGVQQQLAQVVGDTAAKQITNSKNVGKAFDEEAKKMIEAKIVELQAEDAQMQNEQVLTSTVIKESEKRISQYDAEAQAAVDAYNKTNGAMIARFGIDQSGGLPKSAASIASGVEFTNQPGVDYQLNLMVQNAKTTQQKVTAANAGDALQQEIQKLQDWANSLDHGGSWPGSGTPVPPGTGTTSTKTKKSSGGSKSGALSAFVNPFRDLAQQDTLALQPYADAVKKADKTVSDYNKTLSTAITTMKDNINNTRDGQAVVNAYSADINALKNAQSAMRAEDAKILQMLPTIRSDMNRVNQEYKDGKITAQEHRDAISSLNTEYQRLTNTLIGSQGAIQADAQAMQSATNQITSSIESMLQQAMSAEQQMQDQALTDQYNQQTAAIDTQIQSLTNQKDAIDANISALNQQYQMQSEVNKVTQLQEELQNVMNNKSFRIVNTDGTVSWTYDQAKAASIQQQIADQQATMQHDQQVNAMNAEKASIDAQIQALQQKKSDLSQHYQDQKKLLDQYWQYRLNQDTLKQEADRLIAQDGYKKAFLDAQAFVNQMNAEFAQIQWPYLSQGQAIAQSLGLSSPGNFSLTAPSGLITAPSLTDASTLMMNTSTNAVSSATKSVSIHIDTVNTSNDGELSNFLEMVHSVAAG